MLGYKNWALSSAYRSIVNSEKYKNKLGKAIL